MVQQCQRLRDSAGFQRFVTAVILAAGVLVGVETYPDLAHAHADLLHALDKVILGIFVVEIVVKVIAEGRRPWRFFKDGWNVFDFLIVAAAFLPFHAQYVTVLRLLRLLRVLRLVRAVPRLQVLVGALLKSLPSMGYVTLLLGMLFYVYGVAATFLFSANDPMHFRSLQMSLLSLFRAVTLEDWTDLMYIQMYGCANYGYDGNPGLCTQSAAHPILGAFFFVSFILCGTFVMLNLFIGVIMSGMQEAQKESDDERRAQTQGTPPIGDELEALEGQLATLSATVSSLKRRARLQAVPGPEPEPPLKQAG